MSISKHSFEPKTVTFRQASVAFGGYVIYLILFFLLFTKTRGRICSVSLLPVIIISIYGGMRYAVSSAAFVCVTNTILIYFLRPSGFTEAMLSDGLVGIISILITSLLFGFLSDLLHKFRIALAEKTKLEEDREALIKDLHASLEKVKQLEGFLPICSNCKKIRDGWGNWRRFEGYIENHSEAEFTYGICPDCSKLLYPDFNKNKHKN